MKRINLYIILGLVLALTAFVWAARYYRQENRRLSANQTALIEKATYYETQAGLSAASVQQLTFTVSEFKKFNADLVEEAAALNLKVRRLESAARTGTETIYNIVSEWRDSVVYLDGRVDTVRCLTYHDTWLSFDACEFGDTVRADIRSTDTLIQFVHRVPRKFLFIKFGTKAIRQEITSKNPHTNIIYTEYIKLKGN